jgi:hypothetical protein
LTFLVHKYHLIATLSGGIPADANPQRKQVDILGKLSQRRGGKAATIKKGICLLGGIAA